MGNCIICGVPVDGEICESHAEDVFFEFKGTTPDDLTPGRYYQGTVDGFADFGVFVNIGQDVTGLLHTSELDRRLETLDWDPGDTVYVKVKAVHENGNVDLGWSLRQHEEEFRGRLVDDPTTEGVSTESPEPIEVEQTRSPRKQFEFSSPEGTQLTKESPRARTTIEVLQDQIGDPVRIEGEVIDVHQTSGPTIFEIRDETGVIECAAFESAGVRAYPDVTVGDIVRMDGVVEERYEHIQLEVESIEVLSGDEKDAITTRHEEAITSRAKPESVELLADDPQLVAISDQIEDAATHIRRAIFDARRVVVRHNTVVDGYLAASAIERAALSLLEEEYDETNAVYRYFNRRPVNGRIYSMDDAVHDVTSMIGNQDRHNEKLPLFVFVNVAGTTESRNGLELLRVYGAPVVVIDRDIPEDGINDVVDVFVHPESTDEDPVTTTAISANIAVAVNPRTAIRDDLRHLPAVSYGQHVPDEYDALAAASGYNPDKLTELRQAIAFEAFYQEYEDKRELIADILFDDHEIREHASTQYTERVEREVRTATPHLDTRSVGTHQIGVLDIDAYTHRVDFPPISILLTELLDRTEHDAIIGVNTDTLMVETHQPIDMRLVGEQVRDTVSTAGVETRGGSHGNLVFFSGERSVVVDATVDAVAAQFGTDE